MKETFNSSNEHNPSEVKKPAAQEDKIAKRFQELNKSGSRRNEIINDLLNMAEGDQVLASVAKEHYPDWTAEDFKQLVKLLEKPTSEDILQREQNLRSTGHRWEISQDLLNMADGDKELISAMEEQYHGWTAEDLRLLAGLLERPDGKEIDRESAKILQKALVRDAQGLTVGVDRNALLNNLKIYEDWATTGGPHRGWKSQDYARVVDRIRAELHRDDLV